MKILNPILPAITGMICLGLGAGLIGIYGFFVEPLSQEFGVGVAVLNMGPVALLLIPGIISPLVGRMADRVSIRRLMLVGVSIAMVSLLGISRAPSLLLIGVCFLCFTLGLTLYGPVVVNGLLVKIYPGQEARALSIAAMGISLSSAALPPLAGMLLGYWDWRVTLGTLAVGVFLLLWITVWTGIPSGPAKVAPQAQRPVAGTMYRQPAFWLIGLCVALGLNVSIVLAISYPPHFASQGYSVAQAGWFLSFAGLAGLMGKACVAWQGDAVGHKAKWLAIALLLLQVVGLGLLYTAGSTTHILLALSFMGFGAGAFIPMQPYLNSQYFDAAVISQVTGAQMPLFLPFGIVGAPLAGYVYDQSGSYDSVLVALAVTLVVAAVFALKLPVPAK